MNIKYEFFFLMKFISYKCEFVGKSMKFTFQLIKNQTGKSQDFSKYPGIHHGPKLNRDPGN